jgi:hypothetical protein
MLIRKWELLGHGIDGRGKMCRSLRAHRSGWLDRDDLSVLWLIGASPGAHIQN